MLTDASTKPTGTRPKNSVKGDVKSDTKSPAKKTKNKRTQPMSADHKTYKTGPPTMGAGLKGPYKILQKNGPRTEEKALFSRVTSRNQNDIGLSGEPFRSPQNHIKYPYPPPHPPPPPPGRNL